MLVVLPERVAIKPPQHKQKHGLIRCPFTPFPIVSSFPAFLTFFYMTSEVTELLYEWCDSWYLLNRDPYSVLKDKGFSVSVVWRCVHWAQLGMTGALYWCYLTLLSINTAWSWWYWAVLSISDIFILVVLDGTNILRIFILLILAVYCHYTSICSILGEPLKISGIGSTSNMTRA